MAKFEIVALAHSNHRLTLNPPFHVIELELETLHHGMLGPYLLSELNPIDDEAKAIHAFALLGRDDQAPMYDMTGNRIRPCHAYGSAEDLKVP